MLLKKEPRKNSGNEIVVNCGNEKLPRIWLKCGIPVDDLVVIWILDQLSNLGVSHKLNLMCSCLSEETDIFLVFTSLFQ